MGVLFRFLRALLFNFRDWNQISFCLFCYRSHKVIGSYKALIWIWNDLFCTVPFSYLNWWFSCRPTILGNTFTHFNVQAKYLPPAVRLRTKRYQRNGCWILIFLALQTFSVIKLGVLTPLRLQSTITKKEPGLLGCPYKENTSRKNTAESLSSYAV